MLKLHDNIFNIIEKFIYNKIIENHNGSLIFIPYNYLDLYIANDTLNSFLKKNVSIDFRYNDNKLSEGIFSMHLLLKNLVFSKSPYSSNLDDSDFLNFIYPYRAGNERIEPYFDTLQSIVKYMQI